MTPRQKTNAKGRYIMGIARRLLEDRGWMVETARNHVRWFPKKGGGLHPLSMRHDFFGVWDAIIVQQVKVAGVGIDYRCFVQVTDAGNVSHRRKKILDSGFPCHKNDVIMGYRGRGVFRVLHGPTFSGKSVEWKAPPAPKRVPRKTVAA